MTLAKPWPASRVGDELRRLAGNRHRLRRRLRIGAIAAAAVLPLGLSLAVNLPTRLVWNASASAPQGLYIVGSGPVRRGDTVIAWPPGHARDLAARRHYLPGNVPLVKTVAAGPGEELCARNSGIFIEGRQAAVRRRADARGRPLPWWNGCRRLAAQEYFLLTSAPNSFDGRYFGPTAADLILGRATLLWKA